MSILIVCLPSTLFTIRTPWVSGTIISEIDRVLRPDGEFFITLIAKRNDAFKDNQNREDINTIINTEDPEKGIPHYYADLKDIKELLDNFEIIKIRLITEVDLEKENENWHYCIQVKKT